MGIPNLLGAMAGLTPMFTDAQVRRWTDKFKDRAEWAMIETLKYAGEHFVRLARDRSAQESFRDITGNLRSSIGYVIVKDGNVIQENFEQSDRGTEGAKGVQEARRLSRQLAKTHNKGFVLIGMAGMDYALHVENMENKDVISGPEVATREFLRSTLQKALRKV